MEGNFHFVAGADSLAASLSDASSSASITTVPESITLAESTMENYSEFVNQLESDSIKAINSGYHDAILMLITYNKPIIFWDTFKPKSKKRNGKLVCTATINQSGDLIKGIYIPAKIGSLKLQICEVSENNTTRQKFHTIATFYESDKNENGMINLLHNNKWYPIVHFRALSMRIIFTLDNEDTNSASPTEYPGKISFEYMVVPSNERLMLTQCVLSSNTVFQFNKSQYVIRGNQYRTSNSQSNQRMRQVNLNFSKLKID